MLDGLGEELADHADRMQTQGKHARQGAEPYGCNEDDAHDQLRHRPQGIEQHPGNTEHKGCGAVLRAATKATTSENTTAMAVPAMLIAKVSIKGRIQLR